VTARLVVIMGSGETAPTMVKPHRAIFEKLGREPVPAVILDTPYGFQANADDISARAVDYFAASVGQRVEVAELRRLDTTDAVRREAALARVASARWVFAGPGSPTYALRQWSGTELPDLLADKIARGGCIVFASAAALTLGRYTVPVYEIYKVGAEPVWADGLDLLEPVLGTDVAVIPHYDNAEGGNHDTRYCYLGEWRLAALEAQMPDSGWVLGVDEHTGLVLDLEAGSATVVGNGVVTIRRHGGSAVLKSGDTTSIESLPGLASGGRSSEVAGTQPQSVSSDAPRTALHGEIRRLDAAFDKAVDSRDMESAVGTVLEMLDTLTAWAGDTTQSDAAERGNGALRRMIVRLGSLAALGARDPREVVGTFVEGLLAERDAARSDRRYSDADRIRDLLSSAGIEVRDTPGGTEWVIQD
jgi:cyanophycinase-like exopeptidase